MKWNIIIGTLVLSFGMVGQSFGYDLLDRMLGSKGCGCEAKVSCCDTKSGSSKNGATQKGSNGACQKSRGGLFGSSCGCGGKGGSGKGGCSNGATQKGGNGGCLNGSSQKSGSKSACQKSGGLLSRGLFGSSCGCDGKGGKGDGKGGCSNGATQKGRNGGCLNGSSQKSGSKSACQKSGGLLSRGLFGSSCGCGGKSGGKSAAAQKNGGCSNGAAQKGGCDNGGKGGKGGRTCLLDRIFSCNRCCDSGKGGKGGCDNGKGGNGASQKAGGPIKADPPAPVVDPSAYLPSRRVVPVSTTLIR